MTSIILTCVVTLMLCAVAYMLGYRNGSNTTTYRPNHRKYDRGEQGCVRDVWHVDYDVQKHGPRY